MGWGGGGGEVRGKALWRLGLLRNSLERRRSFENVVTSCDLYLVSCSVRQSPSLTPSQKKIASYVCALSHSNRPRCSSSEIYSVSVLFRMLYAHKCIYSAMIQPYNHTLSHSEYIMWNTLSISALSDPLVSLWITSYLIRLMRQPLLFRYSSGSSVSIPV